MTVRLTYCELLIAALAGSMRQVKAVQRAIPSRHGADKRDEWGMHVEGAAGELAVAKAINRHWRAMKLDTFRDPDVGGFQVRTSRDHSRRLIVRPDAASTDVFILVTGCAPVFQVRGWMSAREAKQTQYWDNPNNDGWAFFVPASDLHPMEDLIQQLQARDHQLMEDLQTHHDQSHVSV